MQCWALACAQTAGEQAHPQLRPLWQTPVPTPLGCQALVRHAGWGTRCLRWESQWQGHCPWCRLCAAAGWGEHRRGRADALPPRAASAGRRPSLQAAGHSTSRTGALQLCMHSAMGMVQPISRHEVMQVGAADALSLVETRQTATACAVRDERYRTMCCQPTLCLQVSSQGLVIH